MIRLISLDAPDVVALQEVPLWALGRLERWSGMRALWAVAVPSLLGPLARVLTVFGRVPFFYYVLHIYVIHALVLLVAAASGDPLGPFLTLSLFFPATWGFGLGTVYAVWAGVVLALYPACRWFAALKARRADPWLSYL